MDRAAPVEAGFFPPPPSRRRLSDETNEATSGKKRDGRKWTLGGLFRRRKKKPEADAAPDDSESSSGADDDRGGFLSKRRSRRDTKRKPKLVGTFDHVVVPPPQRPQQLQPPPPQQPTDVNGNLESSLSARSSKESLTVAQHRRQESSGGSGSVDGGGGGGTTRRERREIAKARMEAQRGGGGGGADSSSEDDADRRSPSVGSAAPGKRTRGARTERYIARLHKSEGGGRDLKSATPSPAHSPSVRHRQPPHDAATCTFPPGKAAQYSPRTLGVAPRPIPRGPSPVLSAARSVDSATRRQWHGGGAVVTSGSHDNICAARNGGSQHGAAPPPHADQRRSQSFDSNIHRASQHTPPEEVLVVQFPIARPHTFVPKQGPQPAAPPPPPPPRDPLRKVSTAIVSGVDPPRPMSYAFETGGGAAGSSLSELQYKPYFLHQQQPPLWASSVSYQRRSGSDNQIAGNGANPPPPRLQATTPTRPRPSSVTPESPRMQQRNRRTPPPPQILQYYADQYPRSRRPIQLLQYGSGGSADQPYLSDSQVSATNGHQQHFARHTSAASDFWRQKELEAATNGTAAASTATSLMRQRKPALVNTKGYHNGNGHFLQSYQAQHNSSAHPLTQHQRNDRSRSSSPQTRDRNGADASRDKALKLRVPAASYGRPVASADSQSSLSSQSDVASPVQPGKAFGDAGAFLRPQSKVAENGVSPTRIVPPTPPVRRFSRQNSNSSLEVTEQLARDRSPDAAEKKRRSTNLEEALSELEAIYNSLRLGDEDLLDRAERRDLPAKPGAAGWGRGAESDSGFSYGYGEDADPFAGRRRRAPPLRRAGVPDRVADDMAYRRLNPKDRGSSLQDARSIVSQSGSYLQAAPVLSSNDATPTTPTSAPDVTFDDVLFRNIRHTNNTLRISDPQPPFGIPLGPVTAAAPSDYLHATPATDAASSFRPTFRPRKVPDVVKDDLAYRNLRKDPRRDSAALPSGQDDDVGGGAGGLYYARNDNGNFTLRKKRAIRSLSANLMGFIHREPPPLTTGAASLSADHDFEKAQSFADLPDAVQVAQKILEGKDVIGGGAGKYGRPLQQQAGAAAAASLQQRRLADRSSVCGGTSTETLTDSRVNLAEKRNSFQNRLRVYVAGSTGEGKPPPAASPRASPRPPAAEEEGDSQMEDLLTAMAHEARATSEKLDLELRQLRGREDKGAEEQPAEQEEAGGEDREAAEVEEEEEGEIRNISCDGSVLISEIVRRQRRHEEDDGKDQQVPEVSSDEEADLEVARATAGAGVRTWSLSGRLESPAEEQTMSSKTATRGLGMGEVAGEGAVERMARYKEERRRQLASQYGSRTSDAAAPRRYITRGNSSAAAASASTATASTDTPKVRTTRTSRLRAGNASSDTSPNTDSTAQDGAGGKTRRPGATTTRRPLTTSSGSSIAMVDEKPSTMSDSGPRREKDKSAKRKSNLNRCLTAEAVTADVSTDDSSVRRRRRPVTGLSATPASLHTSPTTVSESSLSPRKSTASVTLRNAAAPATAAKKTAGPSPSSPQHAGGKYPLKRASLSSTGSPRNVPSAPPLSAEQQKPSLNSLASKAKLSEVRLASRNVDNKTIDVCQRVEILTALTKESLARLDKLTGPSAIEECKSVNHNDAQLGPPSNSQTLTTDVSDDISAKSCSTPKKSPTSAPEDSPSCAEPAPADNEELSTSPTRPTSSILKKKVSECKQIVSSPVPVSILKRKTSQDEAGSNSSCSAHTTPVTFSPTVKENGNSNSRRQGILKKRASLDESEVMRRRSCSPDLNHSLTRANCEFRPILKNQRRSSMEELVRRTQSPDPQPHSILKRKASRDDESEERINASPEPQGILKRKSNVSSSSSSSSGSPHISISQSIIISNISPSVDFAVESSDLVRPILKKKSSSEETNTGDSSLTDTPRPILKKKTSIDVEESDERPKKPILKSKKLSQDASGPLSLDSSSQESPTRCLKLRSLSVGDAGAASDGESVKPILKNTTNGERTSPRTRLSFCNDEDTEENSIEQDDTAEPYSNRWNGKLLSPSSGDSEFSNVSSRRRLWEDSFSSMEVANDVLSISVETENSDSTKTLSVAERVLTMETYIDRSRSESVSPTRRTGAVPKRPSSRYMRDRDRFHTQPITQEELDASNKLKSVQDFQSYLNVKQHDNASKTDNDEAVNESFESHEVSSEFLSLPSSSIPDGSLSPQDSDTKLGSNRETMDLGLSKSSSVSAMASLFAQKQEEALQEANKAALPKSKGSPGVRKYRERRKEWANQARVSTQPVTQEEVEEAVRLNRQQSENREENNNVDDDDPSKLSLGERIRLFNQKIVEEKPKPKEPAPRVASKRPARFKTQPVTNEEVETAQKKISNLAASFAKPPDTESLGLENVKTLVVFAS